jgi:hypothetical protein
MYLLLRNPTIHHYIHKKPPLDHMLSQLNPLHTLTICFSKIRFNIILTSICVPPVVSSLNASLRLIQQRGVLIEEPVVA